MAQEAHKISMIEELRGHTLEDLLQEVSRSQKSITLILEEGESKPASQLKPLLRLDGRVPELITHQ